MPSRALFTTLVFVGAIAVLVAVFLDIPMLLTDQGINVNAGLIVSGVAAVGTVGTLLWAVVNGLELRRQADADRREATAIRQKATEEKEVEQSRRVCGWITSVGSQPMSTQAPHAQLVRFSNSSHEPVHEFVAYLVWAQGSGPHTGEELQQHGDVARRRAIVQILPPGNFAMRFPGPSNMTPQGRLGLEIAFTDSAGRHWVRRVPSGNLKKLSVRPVEHYGIPLPLPPYDEPEPWRP